MLKKLLFILIFTVISLVSYSQRPILELTFTAENNGNHVQLDSIMIMNRIKVADTTLYYPDTVLSLNYTGIPVISDKKNSFRVFQNYPNPATDHTYIAIVVPERDKVSIAITDMLGRVLLRDERVLDAGTHTFHFTPGSGNLYFFSARWRENSSCIKILKVPSGSASAVSLTYTGTASSIPQLKAAVSINYFDFSLGNELLYIGYAGGLESGLVDMPEESRTYTFQFTSNVPCPGNPTVEYEGKVYNTIQVFGQCWLKENLNVGMMIPGDSDMTDNGAIEKYCYDDDTANCNAYGGLYQWDELMQYTTQQGTQGICPPGWHVPSDDEWKVLEGAVDSQYKIGDPIWDELGYDGFDAGLILKDTVGWNGEGNGTDLYGFSGLPGGLRNAYGNFQGMNNYGYWWSSKEDEYNALLYSLDSNHPQTFRYFYDKAFGFSVRCVKDE